MKISDFLSTGAENAITRQDLVSLTGVDERKVRMLIHAERKAGKLIMSDNIHGYFMPDGVDDVKRFHRSMTHRAAEILSVTRAAEDVLKDMTGQDQIGGW